MHFGFAWLVMWCVVDAGKRSEIGARKYTPCLACIVECFFSRTVGDAVVVSSDLWSAGLRFGIGDSESCACCTCIISGCLCQ